MNNCLNAILFISLILINFGCDLKGSKNFLFEKVVKCSVPVQSNDKNAESGVKEIPVEIKIGFKSKKQKKDWAEKSGFPYAVVTHGKSKMEVPIEGLSGSAIQPIGSSIAGNVCEGSVGVMDSLSRLWLVFGQDDPTKVVFMAYDVKTNKFVTGHAPPSHVFGMKYQVGKLFYMTAKNPKSPTRAFFKKDGKEIALKEMTLPYWVRLDLSGQQRASVDVPQTFAASAFKSLFKSPMEFHKFFGWNQKGYYENQWAYLANIGSETCIIAQENRASGELKTDGMLCHSTGKSPASVKE